MLKFSSLAIFLCIIYTVKSQNPYSQVVTIFQNANCSGPSLVIREAYEGNLAQKGWDNRTLSAQLTGIWFFYDLANYNTGVNNALMEYAFGPGQYCINHFQLQQKVTSIRFSGAPNDYRSDTFNLYAGDYFQDDEEYLQNDLPNLIIGSRVRSLVITGVSGWTIFDEVNYSGNSICLFPPESSNYLPGFFPDIRANPDIPYGSIRSVRKGCFIHKAGSGNFGGQSQSTKAIQSPKILAPAILHGKNSVD